MRGILISIGSGLARVETHTSPKSIREFKGKSLIEFPEDFCIIDLETTGLNPAYDSIIEIGAIKYSNGKALDSFHSLINPEEEIPDFITDITGITDDMVADAPKIGEILPSFCQFLGDSVIVGHNVNFDINFLYDCYQYYLGMPLKNNFVDSLRVARKLYPDLPHHRLQDLLKLFNFDTDGLHRAMGDCQATFRCYDALKRIVFERYRTLEEFQQYFKRDFKAADIHGDASKNDPECLFYKKYCVFTGKLEELSRKEAMKIVADIGGINQDRVTKDTNFLILGNNDYCTTIKGGKSAKHKKAERYKAEGRDIEILSESVFYEIISDFFNADDRNHSSA